MCFDASGGLPRCRDGPISQQRQKHFIQGLASSYSVEHITGVPKSHAVYLRYSCGWFHIQNETKNSNAHFAKPKRNKNQLQSHLAKRNGTKPKWVKLILKPFRFIRFYSVFSVTLCPIGVRLQEFKTDKHTSSRESHHGAAAGSQRAAPQTELLGKCRSNAAPRRGTLPRGVGMRVKCYRYFNSDVL
jgi:hypothetical protein